jgi:hypothetical protein
MGGISAQELDKRLAFAHRFPAYAHMPTMGLILYPGGESPPSCSICGGADAPIVDGMHLEGCGCQGVWTGDDLGWQMRDDLFPMLIGPPLGSWEAAPAPYPAFGTSLSLEAVRALRWLAHEVYPVKGVDTAHSMVRELIEAETVDQDADGMRISERGWNLIQRLCPDQLWEG